MWCRVADEAHRQSTPVIKPTPCVVECARKVGKHRKLTTNSTYNLKSKAGAPCLGCLPGSEGRATSSAEFLEQHSKNTHDKKKRNNGTESGQKGEARRRDGRRAGGEGTAKQTTRMCACI